MGVALAQKTEEKGGINEWASLVRQMRDLFYSMSLDKFFCGNSKNSGIRVQMSEFWIEEE